MVTLGNIMRRGPLATASGWVSRRLPRSTWATSAARKASVSPPTATSTPAISTQATPSWLSVGGNISLGSITTPSTGRIYLADVSMFLDNGGGNRTISIPTWSSPLRRSQLAARSRSTGRSPPARFQAAAGTSFSSARHRCRRRLRHRPERPWVSATSIWAARWTCAATEPLPPQRSTRPARFSHAPTRRSPATATLPREARSHLGSIGAMTLADLSAGDAINLGSNANILLANATSGETINIATQGSLRANNLTAGDFDSRPVHGRDDARSTVGRHRQSKQQCRGAEVDLAGGDGPPVGGQHGCSGKHRPLLGGDFDDGQPRQRPRRAGDGQRQHAVRLHRDSRRLSVSRRRFDGCARRHLWNFDRNAVLAAAPVASSGSIAIGGPVTTGTFQAAAGTSFSSASITATGDVSASAGTTLNAADIASRQGAIALDSAGALTAGNLTAGTSIDAPSGGNMTVANGNAGTDITLTSGRTLARRQPHGRGGPSRYRRSTISSPTSSMPTAT